MRKVLFIPSGVGLGHATRVHSIIKELRGKVEHKVAAYEDAYNYFEKVGMNPIRLSGFNFHGDYSFELLKTLINEADVFFKLAGDYMKISKLQSEFAYDSIVSDSDPLGVVAANLLKKRSIVIENLDIVFNESKYIPKRFLEELNYQLAFIEQVDKYLTKFAEHIIIPSFTAGKSKLSKKHNVGLIHPCKMDNVACRDAGNYGNFVLVPMSGSKIGYSIISELLPMFRRYKKTRFLVVNFPTKITKKLDNVYLLPFMKNEELQGYFKACKAVVCSAGFSTLTDVLYHKKPSLILPLPNHIEQVCNATFFRRNKFGEVVYPHKTYDLELVEKKFELLMSNLFYYEESMHSGNFSFDGAKKAADIIASFD